MSLGVFAKVREFFEGNASVRRVASDPALSAELLLLFRMILADGVVQPEEIDVFERICVQSFGIEPDDIPKVNKYLQQMAYETTGRSAIELFETLDIERRRNLLDHMYAVAKADGVLDPLESQLIDRTAKLLGLDKPEADQVTSG